MNSMDVPVAGKALDTTASCNIAGVTEASPTVVWEKKSGITYGKVTGTADYNTTYKAVITLSADWYYDFTNATTATIGGKTATVRYDASSGTCVLSVEYKTAKEKLQSIEQNNSLLAGAGVELKDMGLPTYVSIVTDGNKTKRAKVDWNTDNPTYVGGTSFDISNKNGYSFTLQGTVICPENVDAADIKLTTIIKVLVAKDGVVVEKSTEAPTETETESQLETPTESQEPIQTPTVENKTEEITTEVSTEEGTTEAAQEGSDENDDNNLWWLWILLVVVVVAIAFIIFIIIKKRNSDEEENENTKE